MGRKLDGKNVIITGARRGIGRAMVSEFAKNGANIWACVRTKDIEFEEDMKKLSQQNNVRIRPFFFDIKDEEATKSVIKEIQYEKQSVDVLINNAGIPYGGTLLMTPESKLRDVFEVNFFGQIRMMQLISRMMIRQKSGCIINVASVGGIEAGPGYLAYGSSKAALIYATKSVSHELGEYGIRVNALAPGLTDTQMGDYKVESETEKVLSRSSLHRMAQPDEIAMAAVFLASDDASFITGHVLVADGGRLWT